MKPAGSVELGSWSETFKLIGVDTESGVAGVGPNPSRPFSPITRPGVAEVRSIELRLGFVIGLGIDPKVKSFSPGVTSNPLSPVFVIEGPGVAKVKPITFGLGFVIEFGLVPEVKSFPPGVGPNRSRPGLVIEKTVAAEVKSFSWVVTSDP